MRPYFATSLIALALATVSAPTHAQFQDAVGNAAPLPADAIYVNGHINTPGGWQTAMAVSGKTIVATGSEAELSKHKTAQTRVIDLGGKTVLPGMIDMHVHAVHAGLREASCAFP